MDAGNFAQRGYVGFQIIGVTQMTNVQSVRHFAIKDDVKHAPLKQYVNPHAYQENNVLKANALSMIFAQR